ncbi:uncharacterized protein LOC126766718 [Bactrocera neohumeralis]|uniref:uncharacterized protein LOC126766718 n=1 Tax=Bactrocera neohumeralis TaxID=98809 RepID=UPI0021653F66|nr:uncharacterized protein LOC126766718 [Bactrocera neohumeralis]
MPGRKDYISVVKNGQRCQEQKRLLLHNLRDLHTKFKDAFSDVKVSLSTFTRLRPRQCILAGQSGTHNVCVCKIHENMRLKFAALKQELKQKGIIFELNYRDTFKDMMCDAANPDCHLANCENCPGPSMIANKLKILLEQNGVSQIQFQQWTSTDRCELLLNSSSREEFLQQLIKDLPAVAKHDFLARSQAAYFEEMKRNVNEGEFIVTLDFSENYTCQVQDAVQSQHWANVQATLHPYVVYYKKNNAVKNENYVLISENLHHDANAVHLFNTKVIAYLKSKFGQTSIKKVIYFSDGAGSQYKNKFNLSNLLQHKTDFNVEAEWNFFATSHGKGACDGIGGTVKRHAFRASLQKTLITTPKLLYEWAKVFSNELILIFVR